MMGAIAGDIIGSVYEFNNYRATDFPLFSERSTFTDDTVLTIAVARWLLEGDDLYSLEAGALVDLFHEAFERYPQVSWGGMFAQWARTRQREPYGSKGNGSAMRASPIGWVFNDEVVAREVGRHSARVTHDHEEGVRGAMAVAYAVCIARQGNAKESIVSEVIRRVGFDAGATVAELRRTQTFDETCAGAVPQALQAFAESENFEHAIRLAVSIGGDSDTIACITGAIAEAHYGCVPGYIEDECLRRLDPDMLAVIERFYERFGRPEEW